MVTLATSRPLRKAMPPACQRVPSSSSATVAAVTERPRPATVQPAASEATSPSGGIGSPAKRL